jgi:hypothetical protein
MQIANTMTLRSCREMVSVRTANAINAGLTVG